MWIHWGYYCRCEVLGPAAVQSLGRVQLFETPRTAARQASLSLTNSPEFAKVRVHCIGDAISFTRVDFFFFTKGQKKFCFVCKKMMLF